MNNLTKHTNSALATAGDEDSSNSTPHVDRIAKGVATGVAVTTIVHTGRGIFGAMARNPLVMFGLGAIAGYFAHKYRKEIVSVSRKAIEESRCFALRQKEHVLDLVEESREMTETPKNLH